LVGQVLTFARGSESKRTAVNLRHLAKETQKVVLDTFPKNIQFDLTISKELWTMEADPTHLHQVLMNLCVNARDAMPEGGKLAVKLDNSVLDGGYARMHPDAKQGPYVVISVEDSGMGITPEVQDKMFDPFFTTKEIGKGTGLGLSTVSTIVKAHQGFINVYSELGRGTKFKIYFPAKPTQQESEAQSATQSNALPRGRGETILVVDDEANLRLITQETLETFGYRVLTAANGAEAIAIYAQRRHEISVVLTDMMMPVMDGPATIVALQAVNPQVKVIGSSGLGMNETAGRTVGAGLRYFVPKPYTAERLLKMVEQVLKNDEHQGQPG
jgi:CheY-like chemotaxis protein